MPNNDLISREAAIEYLMINMVWHDADGYEVDDADEKRAIITDLVNGIPAIDAAPTVNDWISVNDRMPDNGQDVLVYIDDKEESRITGCNYDNGVWYDCVMNCEIVIPNITHWMPIPEPPKEDDDDAGQ